MGKRLKKIPAFVTGIAAGVLAAVAVTLLLNVTIFSNEMDITLEPGRSYEFENKDRAKQYSVDAGRLRYDYVSRDSVGEVIGYGTGSGRIQIKNGGSFVLTVKNEESVTVAYDPEVIDVIEKESQAIERMEVPQGATLVFTNTGAQDISVSWDGSALYDTVQKNALNMVSGYSEKDASGRFNVPKGGAVVITSVSETDSSVYFPAEWLQGKLRVQNRETPALKRAEIRAGGSVKAASSDPDFSFSITAKNLTDSGAPLYDYVNKDINGKVAGYAKDARSSAIGVSPGGTTVITASKSNDIGLYYPSEWPVAIGSGPAALHTRSVPAGGSVLITNRNDDVSLKVMTNVNAASNSPKIDFTVSDTSGRVMNYVSEYSSDNLTVSPETRTTVTARRGYELIMWFPQEWLGSQIVVASSAQPALEYVTIQSGGSALFVNNDRDSRYSISTDGGEGDLLPKFDYVHKDASGRVSSYGSRDSFERFTVPEGGTSLITSVSGYRLNVWYPYAWKNGTITHRASNQTALSFHNVSPGNSVNIANSDSTDEYFITVESGEEFGYANRDLYGRVTDYGYLTGGVTVTDGGGTLLTASKNYRMRIFFPGEWENRKITLSDSKAPALYEFTVYVNKTAEIANGNPGEAFSVYMDAGFDYISKDADGYIKDFGIRKEGGLLTVGKSGKVVIAPSDPTPVKTCAPYEWLNDLTFTFGDGPVLEEIGVLSEKTVEIVNGNSSFNYSICIEGMENGNTLDYVVRDADGRVRDFQAKSHENKIQLDRGGTTAVTSGDRSAINILIPSEWTDAVRITERDRPAIYKGRLRSSQGLGFANKSETEAFSVATDAGEGYMQPKYEILVKDRNGEILYCASRSAEGEVYIPGGGYAQITGAVNADLNYWLPEEWRNSLVISDAGRTLYEYKINSGETASFKNLDKNLNLKIYAGGAEGGAFAYDGLFYDNKDELADHVYNGAGGEIYVLKGGSVTITAAKGYDMSVWFPMEWDRSLITANRELIPALQYIHVRAGERVTVRNNGGKPVGIRNNSGESPSMPKYDLIYKDQYNSPIDRMEAAYGEIAIPARGIAEIRAVNGFSLEIWIPTETAEDLEIEY